MAMLQQRLRPNDPLQTSAENPQQRAGGPTLAGAIPDPNTLVYSKLNDNQMPKMPFDPNQGYFGHQGMMMNPMQDAASERAFTLKEAETPFIDFAKKMEIDPNSQVWY